MTDPIILNSPALVALLMTVGLFAHRLVGMYLGGQYRCPNCGTMRADAHTDDCIWQR